MMTKKALTLRRISIQAVKTRTNHQESRFTHHVQECSSMATLRVTMMLTTV
jgi:hypothetical protein